MLILCLLFATNQLLIIFHQKKWSFALAILNLVALGALLYAHADSPLFIHL